MNQSRQLGDASTHVLSWIEGVIDIETGRGRRHQLHQPAGAAAAHRTVVPTRLDRHQGADETWIETDAA
jgi:hypothetical protein